MPTTRGIVVAVIAGALAVAGAVWGVEEFVLVAAAAAVTLCCGVVLVVTESVRLRRRLQVMTGPSREVLVGTPSAVVVRVAWTRPSRAHGALVLHAGRRWSVSYPGLVGRVGAEPAQAVAVGILGRLRAAMACAGATVVPSHPGPAAESAVTVPVPTQRRGLWTMEPPALWLLDPFGLVCWPAVSGPALHVVVCPDPAAGTAALLPPLARAGVAGGDMGERRVVAGGGDELAGLRAYVPGDRLHRLHWPALARSGELVVRDFVELQDNRVVLFVDVRPRRDPSILERSVRDAAASGVAALDRDQVVEVRTSAGEMCTVTPGPEARARLLRALAVVGPPVRP